MSRRRRFFSELTLPAKAIADYNMREPGLEPGSLAAPDPKAHSSPEDAPRQRRKVAPAATQKTPDDIPGTTGIAT